MTAKDKLPKDHELAKNSKTMTAGVTTSKLELGATIDIHGYSAKVTHTDAEDTMVQYVDNLVRCTFDTHALNGYLELGTLPVDSALERYNAGNYERAVIEAVTGDCCYQVRIVTGGELPTHATYSYADLILWHMKSGANRVVHLETDTDLLDEADDESNPFETELKERIEQLQAEPEALQFGQALIEDLRAKLDAANQAAEQAEINGQIRINELQRKVGELNADLLRQNDIHTTELLAKNAQIERLEAKAAILAPVCKEYLMRQNITESDMNKLAKEGWQIQHLQYMTDVDFSGQLWAVFIRDLPAAPAPKLAEKVTEAGFHIGAIPLVRPPMPVPANQTIIHQPGSRALTNNVSRTTGETKRIPSLADIQARRDRDTAEIDAIMQRGLDEQEALRRKFAQSSSPFNHIGAQ